MYPRGGRVRVRELDWFDGKTYADPDIDPEAGYQLAADTIYNEVVTLQFVAALAALKSGSGWAAAPFPAIVCLELRTQEVHTVFIEALLAAGQTCGGCWRAHRPPKRRLVGW